MNERVKSIESREFSPTAETFSRYSGISIKDFEAFQSRLAGVNGHCRIVVHPLFTEQYPNSARSFLSSETGDITAVQAELREMFVRQLDSVRNNPKSSPLLVYESSNHITDMENFLRAQVGGEAYTEHGVIIMPTLTASPQLDFERVYEALRLGNEQEEEMAGLLFDYFSKRKRFIEMQERQEAERIKRFPESVDWTWRVPESQQDEYFNFLIDQHEEGRFYYGSSEVVSRLVSNFHSSYLTELGVSTAIVSGAYMTSSSIGFTKEQELGACAGGVAQFMRNMNIKVDISKNVFPSKEKLRKSGAILKQTNR
jgi:hypothetical protein